MSNCSPSVLSGFHYSFQVFLLIGFRGTVVVNRTAHAFSISVPAQVKLSDLSRLMDLVCTGFLQMSLLKDIFESFFVYFPFLIN